MIQIASLPGVLRIILIILVVYYGMKLLSRLLAPYLIRHLSKKAERQFGQQFNAYQDSRQPKAKEGETVIDKMPSEKKRSDKELGEYVDYEEID